MHDTPYIKKNLGPEIVAAMSVIGYEVKSKTNLPCGLQILAAANKEALGVCKAAGLDFIRVEGYVYSHVADEGFIDSCAGELLRYRRSINADEIMIFADIKKKHRYTLYSNLVIMIKYCTQVEYACKPLTTLERNTLKTWHSVAVTRLVSKCTYLFFVNTKV